LFGIDGLRAGWGIVLALVLTIIFTLALNKLILATGLVPHNAMQHSPGPLRVFLIEIGGIIATLAVTWIMSQLEHRPMPTYGLGGSSKLLRLFIGATTGLIAISLLVFALVKLGLLVIDQRLLTGYEVFRYAALWVPAFLAIGFFEEYLFRGYLQYTLARGIARLAPRISPGIDPRAFGFWAAAAIISFGFGALHGSNPGESPIGLLTAALASLIFCFSLWRTGSLWWAIGLHTAWDYGQSFVYGVGDSGMFIGHRLLATHPTGAPLWSGGATGPEGSILCLFILGLLALLINRTQPRTENSYASRMPAPAAPPPQTETGAAAA
jgi:membrane protease YdiL (CAAX protease family)